MGRFAKKNVRTVEDLDKWLASTNKIRLKEKREERVSRKRIISLYIDLTVKKEATYRPAGKLHCMDNKYRSLHDLILVSKYYHPKKNFKEIITQIANIYKTKCKQEARHQYFCYCPNIHMYNWRIPMFLTEQSYKNFCTSITRDIQIWMPTLMPTERENIQTHLESLWDK